MPVTLADLARIVGGHIVGDGALSISGANTLNSAGPSDITLVDSPDKVHRLARSQAGAVVVPRGLESIDRPAIQVDDVHAAFALVVGRFRPADAASRRGICLAAMISGTARLAGDGDVRPGATIGDDVEIGRGSTIQSGVHILPGCRIAEDVTIFPGAVLYENTRVSPRCIIHSGAVLGAYGFGYKLVDGRHVLSAQLGYV